MLSLSHRVTFQNDQFVKKKKNDDNNKTLTTVHKTRLQPLSMIATIHYGLDY
jgi:hypothetical protein